MASLQAHLEQIERNNKTRSDLQRIGTAPEWVVTIAFYEALHLMEAILVTVGDNGLCHNDHQSRNRCLQVHPQTKHLYIAYHKLFDLSIWARYLEKGGAKYDARDPSMVSKATGVWLKAIRDYAKSLKIAVPAAEV